MAGGRNRLVKYYLIKWGYYDHYLADLTGTERIKMKILYLALKELEPEDRKFLAYKYRNKPKVIPSDKEVAARLQMDFKDYREKRIAVETKLNPTIKRYSEMHHNEVMEAFGEEQNINRKRGYKQ